MSTDTWARIVWDYHHVHHTLRKADCIVVLGSHDTRVAERGAELFLEGWAPLVVFSGHLGSLTSGIWTRSEAEVFAEIAVERGVPRDRILLESRSTNTGENVDFTRQLLAEKDLDAASRDRRPEALHGAAHARDVREPLARARRRRHLAADRLRRLRDGRDRTGTTSSTSWWATCSG